MAALPRAGLIDDISHVPAFTRAPRRKSGFYLERAPTEELGLFARSSDGDERNENPAYTDIDRSLSGGLPLEGAALGRPDDTVGIGTARHALSRSHRAYSALGSLAC